MKDAKLIAPGEFRLVECAPPAPGPGEVLVETGSVGVCRSDMHHFEQGRIGGRPTPFPFTLGHETAGTVAAWGAGVTAPAIGTQVAIEPGIACGACEWCLRGDPNLCPDVRFHGSPPVEGTLRQFFTHPAALCIPLREGLSLDDGMLLEPLAIGVHINRLMGVRPGCSFGVIGCGPVGLSALAVAGAAGAVRLVAVDIRPYRLALAERWGATEVIDAARRDPVAAVAQMTHNRGLDVVVEATSDPAAPGLGARITAIGGALAVTGIADTEDIAINTHAARRRGLTVKWIRRSRLALEAAMDLVATGRVATDGLVTHHFPLDDVQRGFELVSRYGDGVFKAAILPNA